MDSCAHEIEQAWAGLAYVREAERARHRKRGGVSGAGNRAVQAGRSASEARACAG
jgi:hypothetical protein